MDGDGIVSRIREGYGDWNGEGRAESKRIEFGTWWRLDETYWRVSWIEATEELVAVERPPSDRYVPVCCLSRREVTELMKKWFDGDNLHALFQRLESRQL